MVTLVEGTNSQKEPSGPTSGELTALLTAAQGLVQQLAAQLAQEFPLAVPREDLVAYGQQGLLEAALRYDSDRGAAFRTFAYYRVRGAMIDGLRKMGPWSRRGYERVALLRAAHAAQDAVSDEEGEPSELSGEEASDRLRKHMASMVTAMTAGVFSAGALQISNASDGSHSQFVAVDERENAEDQLATLQLRQLVVTAVDELPPPEDVVVRRFYLEGDNMDAIAQDLGRSRSWVSRVHTRALSRMGARLRRDALTSG